MPLEQNKLSQSVQTKHLLPKANIEIGVGSFKYEIFNYFSFIPVLK